MYYYRLISSMLKATVSSLLTGLYAVYKGDLSGASLDTNIYRVYNGDNVNDTSGNAQNGTNVGGVTFTTGKVGNAFTFNGSNRISLPNNSLNLSDSGSNAYSISLWVNFSNISGLAQGILTNFIQSGSNAWGWMIWYYNNQIYFTRRDGTSTSYDLSTPSNGSISSNTYHNVVVTRKNGSTKLYLNGVLITSDTSTVDTVYNTTHYPMIGVRQSYISPSYDWYVNSGTKIDAVTAWSKELTAGEVMSLYNVNNGAEYPFTSLTLPSAGDSLGTYNGTPYGGLTYTTGKSGNAFTFNGTTSYVALPTNSMNFEQSFSVSAWVYSSVNLGAQYLPILSNVQADSWFNNPTGWWFEIYSNEVRVYIMNHTNTYNITSYTYAPGFDSSTWINVTFTREVSGSTKIYINGTLRTTNTNSMNPVYALGTTGNIVPTIGNLYVPSKTNYHYAPNGTKIDELNVWTKELTATEVTELYNSGAGKFYPTF